MSNIQYQMTIGCLKLVFIAYFYYNQCMHHFHRSIIEYNFSWMAFNLSLAFLPLIFAIFYFKFQNKLLRFIFFCAWLAYLPNSAYVITDMIHFMEQWPIASSAERGVIIWQYLIFEFFGLAAFLFALYPFEKAISETSVKKHIMKIMIIMNFLIGYGMVLGRVHRVNSWQVITAPDEVIEAALGVFVSLELIGLTILFGLFNNCFYFLFRGSVRRFFR